MRWPAGIINIIDCENVSITGTGTIDGQGVIWWQRFWGDDERSGMVGDYSARGLRWVVDYDCQRPRNILVFESQSILLLIDASEFGKISGVDGLRFKDVQVTAVENTQDRNDSYER